MPVFSIAEVRHWFTPQSGIVDSFVVQDENEITGELKLCQVLNNYFFILPETVFSFEM